VKSIIKRRVGFVEQIGRAFDRRLLMYLEFRHQQHLRKGLPQICISSFDHIGMHVNYFGRYENALLTPAMEFISSNFPEALKNSAIDAGANIGNHTIFFADFFKNVFSFEPALRTFDILKMNIRGLSNVKVINKGLSDSSRSDNIVMSDINQGAARISIESDELAESISVITLDSFVQKEKIKVGLLKIDVEGHELFVLKGAKNILKEQKPIVMFELLEQDIENGNNTFEYLQSEGYKNFYEVRSGVIDPSRFKRLISLIFGYEVGLVEMTYIESRTYNMILATC
jgi:FkbM family methyltransferase